MRRAASAYGAFDYQLDEAEMSLQMSKSGRMRKVRTNCQAGVCDILGLGVFRVLVWMLMAQKGL